MKRDKVIESIKELPQEFELETLIERLIFIEKIEQMKQSGVAEEEIIEQVAQELKEVAEEITEHGFAGLRNKEKGLYFAAGVATTLIVAGVVFGVKKYFFDKKNTGNVGTGNGAGSAGSAGNAATSDASGAASSPAGN